MDDPRRENHSPIIIGAFYLRKQDTGQEKKEFI
jgi:hypothetical protein